MKAVSDGLLMEALEIDKMRSAIKRIVNEYQIGKMKCLTAITDSVSMSGRVRFDTFEQNAKRIYLIKRFYGVELIFMDELLKALQDRNVTARVSYDPIVPEHADGIYLETLDTAFIVEQKGQENTVNLSKNREKYTRLVNSKRFVDMESFKNIRSELRYTSHLAQSSLDGALHALSKAKIYHFLLEDIYGKAMDWKRFSEIEITL